MKTCSKCNIQKNDSEFSPQRRYCKECGREMCRLYKLKNKEKISAYNKKYKDKYKNEIQEYNRKYNLENRSKIQKRHTKYLKKRRSTNINYKLSVTLRNRLKKFLKGQGKTMQYLNCDIDFLKKWFSYLFQDEMNFDNHGKIWHIDHVIPVKLFDLKVEEEAKKCFSWQNLKPMIVSDNLSKKSCVLNKEINEHLSNLEKFKKSYKLTFEIKLDFESYLNNKDNP